MAQPYIQIKQFDTASPSAADVLDYGSVAFIASTYGRYYIEPKIGVEFENHLNEHRFKMAYYADSGHNYIWLVIATIPNADPSISPALYRVDDDFPGRRVLYPFDIGTPTQGMYYQTYANSDTITLPAGAAVYSSLQEVLDAMDDGEWDYDETLDDPYAAGGWSGHGGGGGSFTDDDHDIDFPSLPTVSGTDVGFLTIYTPTEGQLRNLAAYMWTGPFDMDTYKKIFADPMGAILGLSFIPVNVPIGGSQTVTVGNISTGITMSTAANRYVEVDCGSITVQPYWNSYLDYDPYSKYDLFLPYCGTHPLSADEVVGKTIQVKYHVDILTGGCVAMVKIGRHVLYTFTGQCSLAIPITSANWETAIQGAISIAASIGTMAATGGASAPTQIASMASTAVNSLKPNIEKSGSISSASGFLAVQYPYLIRTRPEQAVARGQNAIQGYPAYASAVIGTLSGMTVFDAFHLENIPCTSTELDEIETLLKTGVIL